MKLQSFALAAILPLTFLSNRANAQRLDQIQTESDWDNLMAQGIFDYNSFQLYRELAEGTTVKDTSEYLQAALGNPLSDFITPSGNPESSSLQSRSEPNRFLFRSGQKVQEGRNSGYFLFSSSQQSYNLDFKGRNDNNSWETDRRAVSFSRNIYNFTIGNYTANIGSGLGIGRYDYRPIGIPKDSLNADFLFPDNSYYNGARIDINNRYTALYSHKKFLSTHKAFLGGAASIINSNLRLGITTGATSLSSGVNHRLMGEVSVFVNNPEQGFSAEAGYAESGAGIVCAFNKRKYDIKFWHYDESFINLQSSGQAYPDYSEFHDERFPLTFRQPQAGESGLSLRHDMIIGKLYLIGLSTAWKRSAVDQAALDNTLGARLPLGELLDINARYSERFGRSLGRTLTELGVSFHKQFQADVLLSLWYAANSSNNTRSYAQFYVSIPIRSGFITSGRLRSHFDGKLEYFVEERTLITDRFSLKATYRWQDSLGSQSGPLYLVMETTY